MKSIDGIGLADVTSAYGGPQGDLYELLLGQQLHVGGMRASVALAERAGIGTGLRGTDLCCGTGGGMRALLRFRNVASMVGVDVTKRNIERGRQRCCEEGLADRVAFVVADACRSGLAAASADFVWGEDAWCYVADKPTLIAEAARLVRPGGVIAFTDWVEGPAGLSDLEAQQCLRLMSFANIEDSAGYVRLISKSGCEVQAAEDTGHLPQWFDLALKMIETQFTYDVLATVGFRTEVLNLISDNFRFLGDLSCQGKIIQARFIARRI